MMKCVILKIYGGFMNEETEGALTVIGFMKNHYEYEKDHDHTINYDFFHKTLVENMNILYKNNYKYPEEEKGLLDELKETFFQQMFRRI